ncbi:unnamed protein product [Rangifer tarandus platyrhynchus]|uniref:Uncharacterized protein n=2 Tax=Rangifer tarandus platyrhynchus TaxID=3082113 RepID=A0ACB0EPI8_RANTA|nr:unnamed protein product [Rangifer tarandus platyrhynchus]CAI9702309.1 unnamed protein product [Rangifer tarandus platyrhynchus]
MRQSSSERDAEGFPSEKAAEAGYTAVAKIEATQQEGASGTAGGLEGDLRKVCEDKKYRPCTCSSESTGHEPPAQQQEENLKTKKLLWKEQLYPLWDHVVKAGASGRQ